MNNWKNVVRNTLLRCGLDVRRASTAPSEEAVLRRMLAWRCTTVVIDIGANRGQFVESVRAAGFRGKVVSFEPQSREHAYLLQASQRDPNWQVGPRMALGSVEGTLNLNVSSNSVSSSLLPILKSHTDAAPGSNYTSTETVSVGTLDSVGPEYVDAADRIHLKIDTQGFELEVLKGGLSFLAKVDSLQFEGALKPLYLGEALFESLIAFVRAQGFELYSLTPGFVDSASGQLLQCDCFFIRQRTNGEQVDS
jgi:FkbM family methyltransferase